VLRCGWGDELFQNNSEQIAFNSVFFAPPEPGIRGKEGVLGIVSNCYLNFLFRGSNAVG
jgi:hypothetical protein